MTAYIGGSRDQEDNARVTATFWDSTGGSGTNLGSVTLGPVNATQRGDQTALLYRSSTGMVPSGTRSVAINITMLRTTGSRNDGYVDNASFILLGDGALVISDPSVDTHTADIAWGDSALAEPATVAQAAGLRVVVASHRYADEGIFNPIVTVTDDDGGIGNNTFNVTVNNVPPAVMPVAAAFPLNSAGTRLIATFDDPGINDTHTALVNWGDGTSDGPFNVGNGLVFGTHSFTGLSGPFPQDVTIAVTVTDNDGGATAVAFTVSVVQIQIPAVLGMAMPPSGGGGGGNQTVTEGDIVNFSGSHGVAFDGSSGDNVPGLTYVESWDFGDGGTASGSNPSHTYVNDGVYSVVYSIEAFDGTLLVSSGTSADTVTVLNAAPVVTVPTGLTVAEGSVTTLSPIATFTDVGMADLHTAVIDWGDGSTGVGFVDAVAKRVLGSHVYADNGVYTISVCVTDTAGDSHCDSKSATVTNVTPTTGSVANTTINEGSTYTLDLSFTDPGFDSADAGTTEDFTATVDWGDGQTEPASGITVHEGTGGVGILTTGSVQATHTYQQNGTFTLTVCLSDDDSGQSCESATVTVNNVAPVMTVTSNSIDEGSVATFNGTIEDPGVADSFTLTVDWADGSPIYTHVYPAGTSVFTLDHLYTDNNTSLDYTVVFTISDGSDTRTLNHILSVSDVLSTIEHTLSTRTADEGTTVVTLDVTIVDPGFDDRVIVQVHWEGFDPADPYGSDSFTSPQGDQRTFSVTHVYPDDGPTSLPMDTYNMTFRWLDDDPYIIRIDSSPAINVNNVPPVVDSGPDQLVDEGDTVNISATITDVGIEDTHTYTVNWGDGSATSTGSVAAGAINESHMFSDDGSYAVEVCAIDDDTGAGCDVLYVLVNNVAPSVAIVGSPGSVTEGSQITLTADVSDPGADDQSAGFTIDWIVEKDGQPFASGNSPNITFTPDDDGTYEVTLTAIDKDNLGDQAFTTITATNVAPTVDAGAPTTLNEGSNFAQTGSFTDPGTMDTFTATVDYGDGSGVQILGLNPDDTFDLSHTYADDGSFTVTVSVEDDEGGAGSDTVVVTVNNIAPTVDAGPGGGVNEGSAFVSSGTFSDPGADTFTAAVNYGDSPTAQPLTLNPGETFDLNHVYQDNGVFVVTVTVTDDENAPGSDTFVVTVSNVAPDFEAGPNEIVPPPVLGAFSRAVTFTDPGADVWSGTVNFGDSATNFPLTIDQINKSFVISHTYLTDGFYTVTVTVQDDDGGSHADTFVLEVNFNTAPVANAGGPYTGVEGSPVAFDGSGSSDLENNIVSYDWTFGDTGIGAGVGPSHSYVDNGSYTVCLTVIDSFGESDTDCVTALIDNVNPTVDAGGDAAIDEGDAITRAITRSDLVGYWNFDEAAGAVLDSSGNGNDGTLNGTAQRNPNIAGAPFTSVSALDVTGAVGGNVTVPDSATLSVSDEITVAAWVYARSFPTTYPTIAAKLNSAIGEAWELDLKNDASVEWEVGGPSSRGTVNVGSVPAGEWHHIATTYDGSALTVYVDGVAAGSAPFTGGLSTNAHPLEIGTRGGGFAGFDGQIDELRIYSSALDAAQIADLHGGGGAFTDPGDDTFTATVDYGDGTPADSFSGESFTFNHTYADNGMYTVTVTVTDDDTGSGSDAFVVTVNNVTPSLTVIGPKVTVAEGSTVALAPVQFSDPGFDRLTGFEDFTATIDWGDGSDIDAGAVSETPGGPGVDTTGSVVGSHVYADDGSYVVEVCVTDDDDATICAAFDVDAVNLPPTVDAGADQSANEGAVVSLAPSTFNDLGTLDTHTATIDWGDGTSVDAGSVVETPFGPPGDNAGANGLVFGSHVYADNGTYTVEVCVTDDEGAQTCDTLQVTITNVAPTVDAGANQSANEGAVVSLAPSTFNDQGTADTHTATVDWGDTTPAEAGAVSESPSGPPGSTAGADGTVSGSHVYADNGTYTVEVCVTDDEGAETCDTLAVTIGNVAPTVDAGLDQTADEGAVVSLAPSTFNDLGTADTHTATVDWGDGSPVDAGAVSETPDGPPGDTAGADGTVSGSHVYADNGSYTVEVCVTDDEDAETCDTLIVTISNVAPTVEAGADQTTDEGTTVNLDPAEFNDLGTADTQSATVNWGDLTPNESLTVVETPTGPAGSTAGTDGEANGGATHVYADNGTYTVTVTVTDDDLGVGSDTFTVTVNNVAPTVDAGLDQIADEGAIVSLDPSTFNDLGTADSHTATINWGDGSSVDAGAVSESPSGPPGSTAGADGTVSGSHVYADNGTYTVTVVVLQTFG